MKEKIKAFTLLELMIGMIIGSIIVALCYSGYRIISNQYRDYKNIKDQLQEGMMFQFVLNTDFCESQKVQLQENNLIFIKDSAKVSYVIEHNLLLRKENETIDTFIVSMTDFAPVYIEDSNNNNYIKELSFQVKILNEETTLNFQKAYSAEVLMQKEKTENYGN